jgi:hypothetical protein
MNDYEIKILTPTSTGNQMAYWDGYYAVPTWQMEIGPESEADTLWAEAIAYDREHFPNVHIHWSYEGRDCDGGHGDYGIYWADDRFISEDGSIDVYKFWTFYVEMMVSAYAISGTLKVESDPYETNNGYAEWSESTEEGYRAREMRLCADDCETPRNTVYDEYAQRMGY